jgi:hypothetical protein
VADQLAGEPRNLTKKWMQMHGQEWWLRSVDAMVVTELFHEVER